MNTKKTNDQANEQTNNNQNSALDHIKTAKTVFETERQAIAALSDNIDEKFNAACNMLLKCQGRIIVIGMGKSGHVGGKMAATLASTGSPAFFIHPAEAGHGDLGMVIKRDVIILISNSGETPEICQLLPTLKQMKVPMIALTGRLNSTLSQACDITLNVAVAAEACPLGLAPTASTTAAIAMGDALAICLQKARGFSSEDFAGVHPSGTLGKQLRLIVKDIMRSGDDLPIIKRNTPISNALLAITEKRLGMALVVNDDGTLCGIFTDGDLRRTIQKPNWNNCLIDAVMSENPITIPADMKASEALYLMESRRITSLAVIDNNNKPIGVCHLHDILNQGLKSNNSEKS